MLYSLGFSFGCHRLQLWIFIVQQNILIHCVCFFLKRKLIQSVLAHSLATHSCSPLGSRGKVVFEVPGWTELQASLSPCVWSTLTHAQLLFPQPYSGALVPLWSQSNVTSPGCCVPPPPCKGPISAEGYHHTGNLGRKVREGQCVKGGKNVEILAANLEGHLQLTGITSAFGVVLLDLWQVAKVVRSYKTPGRSVWVAGSNDVSFLSEWSST